MTVQEAGYLALHRSGELKLRAESLESRLAACDICAQKCGVNRFKGEKGFADQVYCLLSLHIALIREKNLLYPEQEDQGRYFSATAICAVSIAKTIR
jgi:uncharacterized Fe-S radical SAM superfamily protein PflX